MYANNLKMPIERHKSASPWLTELSKYLDKKGVTPCQRIVWYYVLAEVLDSLEREIYHIGDVAYGIKVLCENVIIKDDVTHIVLSIENSELFNVNS